MEIAFQAQRWDTLTTIPKEGGTAASEVTGARELFHWWARDTANDAAPAFATSGMVVGE